MTNVVYFLKAKNDIYGTIINFPTIEINVPSCSDTFFLKKRKNLNIRVVMVIKQDITHNL